MGTTELKVNPSGYASQSLTQYSNQQGTQQQESTIVPEQQKKYQHCSC